ncbi:MAG: HEAT repeat domain-containing protein, partial [Candidatus Zixiibacteriota bacterium]
QLTCDDYDVRKFIVDILGLIKDKRAVEPICQRLWDENVNVACSAAEALGELGSDLAIPHLIAAFDKTPDLRVQAVEAFGKIKAIKSLPNLYMWLTVDDPVTLYAVIEAIGSIGAPESVAKLAPFLQHADEPIAEAAMSAIISISVQSGGKVEVDLPLDRFTDYLFDGVRRGNQQIADFTLSRLKHWYGSKVVRNLLDVIEYVDDDRLSVITEALINIGPSAGKQVIARMGTANKETKLRLLDIVKQFIDSDLAEALMAVANDPEPDVRQKIAHILGLSGHAGASETLKKLALDSNGHVRGAAFAALGWISGDNDVDFIFSGMDDKYPDVREAVVGALIIVGGPRVVAKLTADLYHENVERQRLAATALGWIGESAVVEPLLRAVNHPDAGVRKSSVAALARIGSVADVEPIVLALNDENSGVRKAAVSALVTLRPESAIQDIRLLLDDPDVWVRYHTINAIVDLKRSDYAEYLMPYLADDQDIIKIAAAKALAQLNATEALPALRQLSNERNKDVVQVAGQAVSSLGGRP